MNERDIKLLRKGGKQMIIYRLYTEDKNAGQVTDLVSKYFDGATIYLTDGLWKGQSEASIVIEIIADAAQDARAKVFDLRERIKTLNKQESVMLTITEGEVYF